MQFLAEYELKHDDADTSAAKYEMITEPIRYSGATIARSRAIKIRSTTIMVRTMMNRMS